VARLLKEIEWGQPLVELVDDPEWTTTLKKTFGTEKHGYRYLARCKWLRETLMFGSTAGTSYAPQRLVLLAVLVTSQENSCRYCYGAARAYLKMLGLSEKELDRVEHDVKTAGADDKEQALLHFCRDLSRSNPRPARAEFERLVTLGYDRLAMVEIAGNVAGSCLANRVSTFLAMPLSDVEDIKPGLVSRLLSPVMRLLHRSPPPPPLDNLPAEPGPFFDIVSLLKGTMAVPLFDGALKGAFASPVLAVRTKAWVFAVVARALDCHLCETGAARLLEKEGVSAVSRARVLGALAGPELDATEKILLPWVRETVHYQTEVMQRKTHELRARVGDDVALEAIGLASLANACSRLSMLAQ
jgi:alkylhydroperoxidase family enzyme